MSNKSMLGLLLEIRTSEHGFVLGGSRRMAARALDEGCDAAINVGPQTDFDFNVGEDQRALMWLASKGFTLKVDDEEYMDTEAVAVYEHNEHPVQVVIRKDILFYKKVFDSIDPEFFYNYLWKSSPMAPEKNNIRKTMNMLFAMARTFEKP